VESLGALDSAGDRSVGRDLSLHLLGTSNSVVSGSPELGVVKSSAAVHALKISLVQWAGGWLAVTAHIDCLATFVSVQVVSSVLQARGMRDSGGECKVVDS